MSLQGGRGAPKEDNSGAAVAKSILQPIRQLQTPPKARSNAGPAKGVPSLPTTARQRVPCAEGLAMQPRDIATRAADDHGSIDRSTPTKNARKRTVGLRPVSALCATKRCSASSVARDNRGIRNHKGWTRRHKRCPHAARSASEQHRRQWRPSERSRAALGSASAAPRMQNSSEWGGARPDTPEHKEHSPTHNAGQHVGAACTWAPLAAQR